MNPNDKVQFALAVVLLLGALGGYIKWLRPRFKRVGHDVRASRDALLGRDEIRDSITNELIAPALPGIGQRVASLEQAVGPLSVAIARLADTHERLEAHELRINRLEKSENERAQSRTESIELLRTIEAAIKADPNQEQ